MRTNQKDLKQQYFDQLITFKMFFMKFKDPFWLAKFGKKKHNYPGLRMREMV